MQEAVEKIKAGIDLEKAKAMCKEGLGVSPVNGLDITEARSSVYEGQPALRVKFRFTGEFEMVVDFQGNCLAVYQDGAAAVATPEQRIDEASSQIAQAHHQF
jgi:hypothetical protein